MPDDERAQIERHVQHVVKSYVGVTARVQVLDPGKIERSQGKARRVVDLRPKD
jgi:phenylacetate-CoA ligase